MERGKEKTRVEQNRRISQLLKFFDLSFEEIETKDSDDIEQLYIDPDKELSSLRKKFKKHQLEDLYDCNEDKTQYGTCLHLIDKLEDFYFPNVDPCMISTFLNTELQLVYGIGPILANKLRGEKYTTIESLISNPRFSPHAIETYNFFTFENLLDFKKHILGREKLGPKKHDLSILLSSLVDPNKIVVLDLETLGFAGSQVILFGLAYISGNCLEIHQYLVRNANEERAALAVTLKLLGEAEAIVTYNGSTAEIPWLRQRANLLGVGVVPNCLHFDLLHPTRARYVNGTEKGLPDARLGTVEKAIIGMDRLMTDVPGAYVPLYYQNYREKKNIGPLISIIDHNRADLVATAKLLSILVDISYRSLALQ